MAQQARVRPSWKKRPTNKKIMRRVQRDLTTLEKKVIDREAKGIRRVEDDRIIHELALAVTRQASKALNGG